METPCHFIVEGNPAIVYASRDGSPSKVLPTLERFLDKFWQERDISGESSDTPECLIAQIVVRFGFEICEDDYSNLKVGLKYDPTARYLYFVDADRSISVWVTGAEYEQNPQLGINACQTWVPTSARAGGDA
ncbi:histidine kinase [Myxacorys almedinensis]|uniref:Histidine kinase n=1 Tax=Myxacorys almedinensis A TaxID=2690445 RepID=A0A8J8CHB5_9CYAN|nr:histidine kinase [Myxacorys almedinensis]NDJ16533.1 histidine kinase [Myxacorys almedinensis A]